MYGVHDDGMERTKLTVGVLAERSGVGIETLRFYEREGLLPTPARSRAGYRLYSEDTVERVRFIRRAKELGFTLEEIVELLALKVTHGKSCHSVRDRALAKLSDMDRKLKDLRQMRRALNAVVQSDPEAALAAARSAGRVACSDRSSSSSWKPAPPV